MVAADLHPGHLAARGQPARRRRHEVARPLHRAHPRHPGSAVQQSPDPQRLGQEADVEAGVVGHHRPPGQAGHQQVGDVIESGRPAEFLGDEPVNVGGADIHARAGVDERGPAALDPPGGVGEHERDLQDRVRRGGQARGLQVDDGVADTGGLGLLGGCGIGSCLSWSHGEAGTQRASVGGRAVVEGHRPDPLSIGGDSQGHGAPCAAGPVLVAASSRPHPAARGRHRGLGPRGVRYEREGARPPEPRHDPGQEER